MDVITTKGKHLAPAEPVKTGSFRKMLPLILMIAALLVVGTMGSFALLTQSGAPVRNLFKAAPRFVLQYDDNVADEDISVPGSSTVYDPTQFKIDTSAPGERAGWEFTGWNTAADGSGTSYAVGDTVTLTEAEVASGKTVKLYAQWRELYKVNVSYDKNTTDNVTGMPANETVRGQSSDVSVTLGTAPSREGYEFAGWNTAADGSGTSYTAGQEITVTIPAGENEVPLNLYAQWDKIYSYTLYVGLGSLNGSDLSQEDVTNIPGEWTWESGPYCYSITKEQTGDSCDFVLPTNIPEVNGGLFMGYRSEGSNAQNYGPGGTVTVPRKDEYGGLVSLQMQWLNGDYAVIYDPNGGTGAPQPSTAVDAADQHLFNIAAAPDSMTKNIPGTTTAMTFLGWADTPDATAPQYSADGTSVSAEVQSGLETTITLQRDVAQVKTLYAVWGFEYRLHFDEHADIGGNWSGAEGHVKIQDMVSYSAMPSFTVIIPKDDTPERLDYYFGWWSVNQWHLVNETRADGFVSEDTFTLYSNNPSVTLWARYRPAGQQYLNFAAGNAPGSRIVNMPANLVLSTTEWELKFPVGVGPTDSNGHYIFKGWALSPSEEEPTYMPGDLYVMDLEKETSRTLYALWTLTNHNFHLYFWQCLWVRGSSNWYWQSDHRYSPDIPLDQLSYTFNNLNSPGWNNRTDVEFLGWVNRWNTTVILGMGEEPDFGDTPFFRVQNGKIIDPITVSVSSHDTRNYHTHQMDLSPVFRRIPSPHEYKVVFNLGSGQVAAGKNSYSSGYIDQTIEEYSFDVSLTVTRAGYKLLGWAENSNPVSGDIKYSVDENGHYEGTLIVSKDDACTNTSRHSHVLNLYPVYEKLNTFEVWFGENGVNGKAIFTDTTNTLTSYSFTENSIGSTSGPNLANQKLIGWSETENSDVVQYEIDSNNKIICSVTVDSNTDSHMDSEGAIVYYKTLYPVWKQLYTFSIVAGSDSYRKNTYGWRPGNNANTGSVGYYGSYKKTVEIDPSTTNYTIPANEIRMLATWLTSGTDYGHNYVNTDPNYVFVGWTVTQLGKNVDYPVTSNGYFTQDVDLEVEWSDDYTTTLVLYPVFERHFKLNYNANGGTFSGQNEDIVYHYSEVPNSYTFTVSEILPTRGNYLFVGWSTNQSANEGTYGYPYPNEEGTIEKYNITKNLQSTITTTGATLYAIWYSEYRFEYNSNGGTNSPGAAHFYINTNSYTYVLNNNYPTYDGYEFVGWSTTQYEPGTVPESGLIITTGDNVGTYTASVGADGYKLTTFYAVWKANTPDGATNPDATGNGLLGMTMLGRGFASATADTQNVAAEDQSKDADAAQNSDGGETDLSGEEKKIDYIFTVDGEEIERQTLADGETIQQPGDPSKEEEGKVFVFVGWFTDGPDGSEVQLFTDKDDDGEIDAEVVTVTEDSQDVTVWAVFEEEKEEQSSESEEDESGQAGQGESGNDKPTEEASEEKSAGETPVGEQGSGQTDPSTGGENTAQEKQEDQTNGVSNQTDQSGNGTDGKSETPKEDPVNPVTDPVTEPTTPSQDENQGTTEEEAGEPASGGEDEGNGDEEESITQGSADDPENPEQQNEVNSGDPPVDDTPPAEQPEGGTPEGGEGA